VAHRIPYVDSIKIEAANLPDDTTGNAATLRFNSLALNVVSIRMVIVAVNWSFQSSGFSTLQLNEQRLIFPFSENFYCNGAILPGF
jgi:hypothetical protein